MGPGEGFILTTRVEALVLKNQPFDDWHQSVSGRWSIEDLRADPRYRDGWISFDCMVWDHDREALFLGLTSINTDIFWKFDPGANKFESLDFPRVSDRFDAKFHRSLELDSDGSYIAATAMLHDMDQQHLAAGGKLIRYRPDIDEYEILDVPVPGHYIQSIVLDRQRRLVYGFTYPAEYMFVFDLDAGTSRTLAYIGNARMICQSHCAVLDRDGRVWGTWGENRAFEDDPGRHPIRYFCYDPRSDDFTWFQHGPPKTGVQDHGNLDHLLLGSDGLIYAGSVHGGLSSLDPQSGEVTHIGKPYPGKRLAGLVQATDGHIYGAGNEGMDERGRGLARLFRYRLDTHRIEDLGPILDKEIDDGAIKVHMLIEAEPGTFYAAENDHLWRSSYLWRCNVDA
jgi:hypothetical protein